MHILPLSVQRRHSPMVSLSMRSVK
jgi:hypothetical protein